MHVLLVSGSVRRSGGTTESPGVTNGKSIAIGLPPFPEKLPISPASSISINFDERPRVSEIEGIPVASARGADPLPSPFPLPFSAVSKRQLIRLSQQFPKTRSYKAIPRESGIHPVASGVGSELIAVSFTRAKPNLHHLGLAHADAQPGAANPVAGTEANEISPKQLNIGKARGLLR